MRLVVLVLALFGAAAAAAQTGPPAPAADQTHPRVTPSSGHRHTRFVLAFTMRQAAGVKGVSRTDYRVVLAPPARSRAACRAPAPRPIDSGSAGTRRHVRLMPPSHGWCLGRYAATVYLESGPYCPKPQPGERPRPCPLFASRLERTGTARFTVRR